MDYKVVIGAKDGKSYQKELKGAEAEALHKKSIGEKISGDELGFSGYEFVITGGSDKCGFPMRKGINSPRKSVMVEKSVGCSGKNRNKKKQKGLFRRRTVCGERITKIIRQINLKVIKEGSQSLEAPVEQPAQEESEEAPAEAPAEKPAEETPKEEDKEEPAEEEKPAEEPTEEPKEKVKPEPEEENKEEPKQ